MALLDRGRLLPDPELIDQSSGCICPLASSWHLFRLLQPLYCPGHQSTSAKSRLIRVKYLYCPDVRVIESILGTNGGEELDGLCNQFGDISSSRYNLMHSMAGIVAQHSIFVLLPRGRKTFHRVHSCAPFATEVVRRTRDIHIQSEIYLGSAAPPRAYIPTGWGSPLVRLVLQLHIRGYDYRRLKIKAMARSGLHQWLQLVKDAGVDLYEYGRKENALLNNPFSTARTIFLWHGSGLLMSDSGSNETEWLSTHYQLRWYLYGFTIGPNVEDVSKISTSLLFILTLAERRNVRITILGPGSNCAGIARSRFDHC